MKDALSLVFRQYAASHSNEATRVVSASFFRWLRVGLEMANVESTRRIELEQEHQRQQIKSNAAIKALLKWLVRRQSQAFNTWCVMVQHKRRCDDLCRKVMRKMMAANLHAGFR